MSNTKLEILLSSIRAMAAGFCQETEDSSNEIYETGEIDRGHNFDCYDSVCNDGANYIKGLLKVMLDNYNLGD